LNIELLNNRCGFYLLFFNGFFDYTSYFFRLFEFNDFIQVSPRHKFIISSCFSDIYSFVYVNAYALFFVTNYVYVNVWFLFFCNTQARRYLIRLKKEALSLYLDKPINRKKAKMVHVGIPGYLMGFKLHCLGRFSRKQRASSLWYKHGKIPLNTMAAVIDFSAVSVPIENSVVTVKMWLYRYEGFMKFYFKVL